MPSFRQLLQDHAPVLLIDSASSNIQVGLFPSRDEPAQWATSTEEAGSGIFQDIETLAVKLTDVASFVFCTGPGSVLGIRTAAMAIRAWNVLKDRPVFGYSSLALVAASLADRDLTVIADARREQWHRFKLGSSLERVPAMELSGRLVMPEGFRHWSALPAGVTTTPYAIDELLTRCFEAELFFPSSSPDAMLHEEPKYVTWTPLIHRAPSAIQVKATPNG